MNDRRRFLEDAADNEEQSLPPQVAKLRRGELVQFLEEELQLKYNLVTNTIWSRGGADAGVIPQHALHPAGHGIWR